MTLHSFGCSFVFGSDLDPESAQDQVSHETWPALVAQAHDQPYVCHAWPGAGNLRISHALFNCDFEPGDTAVVCWTWIDRFDLRDYPHAWGTIRPDNTTALGKTYYRDLHSQYRDQLTNLLYVHSAQKYLESRGVSYVMTYMDHLLWETVWHDESAIRNLVELSRGKTFDFDGETFLEWSRRCGHAISANLHPLVSAHRAAANYVVGRWHDIVNHAR